MLVIHRELRPAAPQLQSPNRAIPSVVMLKASMDAQHGKAVVFGEGIEVTHGIRHAINFVVRTCKQSDANLAHSCFSSGSYSSVLTKLRWMFGQRPCHTPSQEKLPGEVILADFVVIAGPLEKLLRTGRLPTPRARVDL